MISPKDLEKMDITNANMDNLIKIVDDSIKKHHNTHNNFETAYLDDIYPDHVLNLLLSKYYDAGWHYIYYNTYSDYRETFTTIRLSTTPIDNCNNFKQYKRKESYDY